MALGTSSKRYSKALISHSIDEGNLDVMFEEIRSLINILEEYNLKIKDVKEKDFRRI